MSENTEVTPTKEWGELYWAYNMPLQMWGDAEEGWRVVNYMPRKEMCCGLDEPVTAEELPQFCQNASARLRNLALLFEALGRGEIGYIYYPDKTVDEARADFQKEIAKRESSGANK